MFVLFITVMYEIINNLANEVGGKFQNTLWQRFKK